MKITPLLHQQPFYIHPCEISQTQLFIVAKLVIITSHENFGPYGMFNVRLLCSDEDHVISPKQFLQ